MVDQRYQPSTPGAHVVIEGEVNRGENFAVDGTVGLAQHVSDGPREQPWNSPDTWQFCSSVSRARDSNSGTPPGSGLSMRYLPYAAASSEPNVIVDGTANDRTLITLSHWRRSGTPADLMADTSTAIVFNYLDRPDLHVPADVVSNNHFDEDGLVGIYALLEPEAAASRRDLLIDVAQARDFGVFRSRRAARIAFAISAHADPSRSPFPAATIRPPRGAGRGGVVSGVARRPASAARRRR